MRKKSEKALKIVLVVLLSLSVVAGLVFGVFLQTTYKIDSSLIVKNPDYNVYAEQRNGYTTLVKKDPAGNVLDADFKVIGFTDTHLDAHKDRGNFTMEFIIRNIVSEKPDLVVFIGDNITAGFNRRRANQLCKVMEELGVYWTCVLGNHEGDNIWSVSRKKMTEIFASYPHCLVEAGKKYTGSGEEVWGWGNHAINLADSQGDVIRSLILVDGGGDISKEDAAKYADEIALYNSDYDYIKESQITWYKETIDDIASKFNTARSVTSNGRAKIPSTVFDHIAVPEYTDAYEKITGETEVTRVIPDYYKKDANGDFIITGVRREGVCCSGHNSGFFDAMLEKGSTDLVVCGHDHVNDFVLSYKGITLAYNEVSGYSSYNMITKKLSDTMITGYTRYTFRTDGSFELEPFHNADLYPDAQADIAALYK